MRSKYITVSQLRTMKKHRAEGFTNVEIAELMGLGESTIYNHLPVGTAPRAKKRKRKVKPKRATQAPAKHYSVACNLESYEHIQKISDKTGATKADVVNEIIRKHKRKWWQP